MFVAGGGIEPGILAPYPSLTDLEEKEMKATVDFRSVYASLLEDWLGLDAAGPLGGSFERLNVVA